MVKIFVGNLASSTTVEELRKLFAEYGKVSECDIVKNFGFVHMSNKTEAEEAISNLNQYELNDERMNVEISKGRPKSTTKLHVSNLGEGGTNDELRGKFEEFGSVVECDIVKDFAFVHMESMEDAMAAIDKLDNTAFKGKLMNVQLSTSRLRTAPGMGDQTGCYVCGRPGHWSKDCSIGRRNGDDDDGGPRGRGRGGPRGPPGYGRGGYGMARAPASEYMGSSAYSRSSYPGGMPPPPRRLSGYGAELGDTYAGRATSAYLERSPAPYARERYTSSVDYYEKYRARPYGSSYFEDARLAYLPPPPSSSLSRISTSVDPYDRRPLPPPSAAAYYARDRSPIRRVPVASAYEHSREPPVSAARSSAYAVPRAKDPYAARYAPY